MQSERNIGFLPPMSPAPTAQTSFAEMAVTPKRILSPSLRLGWHHAPLAGRSTAGSRLKRIISAGAILPDGPGLVRRDGRDSEGWLSPCVIVLAQCSIACRPKLHQGLGFAFPRDVIPTARHRSPIALRHRSKRWSRCRRSGWARHSTGCPPNLDQCRCLVDWSCAVTDGPRLGRGDRRDAPERIGGGARIYTRHHSPRKFAAYRWRCRIVIIRGEEKSDVIGFETSMET